MTIDRGDKPALEIRFVKISDTECEVRDAKGRLLGTSHYTPAGDIELSDSQGRVLATLAAADIAKKLEERQQ
jgi:hypothetical protein